MGNVAIGAVKCAFAQALQAIPDFLNLSVLKKGEFIDNNFNSLMEDLMEQFGMVRGRDYAAFREYLLADYAQEMKSKESALAYILKTAIALLLMRSHQH